MGIGGKYYYFHFTIDKTKIRAMGWLAPDSTADRATILAEIPNSLPYGLSVALCFLCCQTHTHKLKQNLGCLICFKTNLKAIYVFCLQTERNHCSNVCDSRSVPAGDYFISKTGPITMSSEPPEKRLPISECTHNQMIRKATEIRKPWSPF